MRDNGNGGALTPAELLAASGEAEAKEDLAGGDSAGPLLPQGTHPIPLSELCIDYHDVVLSDLLLVPNPKDPTNKTYLVQDQKGRFPERLASPRFFRSLIGRTGFRSDFLKLFTPNEVLGRIVERDGDMALTVASDNQHVLGAFKPGDPMVRLADAKKLMEDYAPLDLSYVDGELRAIFAPTKHSGDTDIVSEQYRKQYVALVPVDGLEAPRMAPLMMRLTCMNQLLAAVTPFVAPIKLGRNNDAYNLGRALVAYESVGDKHYDQIARSLGASRDAMASAAEVLMATKALERAAFQNAAIIIGAVWEQAGKTSYRASQEHRGRDPKLLRRVVSNLNRYDLLQMLTEARTHFCASPTARDEVDRVVGQLIARSPDIERSNRSPAKPSPAFFFKKSA